MEKIEIDRSGEKFNVVVGDKEGRVENFPRITVFEATDSSLIDDLSDLLGDVVKELYVERDYEFSRSVEMVNNLIKDVANNYEVNRRELAAIYMINIYDWGKSEPFSGSDFSDKHDDIKRENNTR